jgi:hypothetical protein
MSNVVASTLVHQMWRVSAYHGLDPPSCTPGAEATGRENVAALFLVFPCISDISLGEESNILR